MNTAGTAIPSRPRRPYRGLVSLVLPLAAFVLEPPIIYLIVRHVYADFFSGAVMVYTFVSWGCSGAVGIVFAILAIHADEEWSPVAIIGFLASAILLFPGVMGLSFLL